MTARGNRDCPQWRIDRWNRIAAVRRFVDAISDREMMAMAFMMMQGAKPRQIMDAMKIDAARYGTLKECLAFGLLFAGVAVRE